MMRSALLVPDVKLPKTVSSRLSSSAVGQRESDPANRPFQTPDKATSLHPQRCSLQ
jgi:hypothetical protein